MLGNTLLAMITSTTKTRQPFVNERDLPLDFIRGVAMFLVVVNHLPIPSHYYILTVDRIGVVTGAELFVIISGIALGMVHRTRMEMRGWASSARALFKRALQIYATIIAVTLAIWFLSAFGLNLESLTRWTDPNTGESYFCIPPHPLEHPLIIARDLLELRLTPSEINILGYFVVISMIAPFALWLLQRRQPFALLLISWGFYAFNLSHHHRVTRAIFENPFPLLSWQMPFINALVIGYHRPELSKAISRNVKLALIGAATAFVLLCMFFTLNNPWFNAFQYGKIPHWARLSIIPPDTFNLIYAKAFGDRTWLYPLRLLDSAAIIFVMYCALKKTWAAANQIFGWFFLPIGQASLYVFVMHLWLIVALSMPAAQQHRMLVNTVLHTVALLTLWLMVRVLPLLKMPLLIGRVKPQLATVTLSRESTRSS